MKKITEYFPDGIRAEYINRDFLFNVIYHVDNSQYKKYEKIKSEEEILRGNGTFKEIGIEISKKWTELLNEFPSLNSNYLCFNFMMMINYFI